MGSHGMRETWPDALAITIEGNNREFGIRADVRNAEQCAKLIEIITQLGCVYWPVPEPKEVFGVPVCASLAEQVLP